MQMKVYKMKIIHWNFGDAERAERGLRTAQRSNDEIEPHRVFSHKALKNDT